MGTHHFTVGYSNPVLIISAISHRIRLESFFFFVHLATRKVLFQPQGLKVYESMSVVLVMHRQTLNMLARFQCCHDYKS